MFSLCSCNDDRLLLQKTFMAGKQIFWAVNFITSPAIGWYGKTLVLGPVYIYVCIYIYNLFIYISGASQ